MGEMCVMRKIIRENDFQVKRIMASIDVVTNKSHRTGINVISQSMSYDIQ